MKEKHIQARIDQCLRNAELSTCPRRKFGAMLIDPPTNSIIADGYNGPARGEDGGFCAGSFCERDGFLPERAMIDQGCRKGEILEIQVHYGETQRVQAWTIGDSEEAVRAEAREWIAQMAEKHPPAKSGTHMEKGCHHAESNAIANACRRGASTEGAWLIVTGEPCELCAKLIHHCGITRVVVVRGGYVGGDAGVIYLQKYGVKVDYVDGPQDPRMNP